MTWGRSESLSANISSLLWRLSLKIIWLPLEMKFIHWRQGIWHLRAVFLSNWLLAGGQRQWNSCWRRPWWRGCSCGRKSVLASSTSGGESERYVVLKNCLLLAPPWQQFKILSFFLLQFSVLPFSCDSDCCTCVLFNYFATVYTGSNFSKAGVEKWGRFIIASPVSSDAPWPNPRTIYYISTFYLTS